MKLNNITKQIQPILASVVDRFNLSRTILYVSISRSQNPVSKAKRQHWGHNKILEDHEKEALHPFIRSLLLYGILPSFQVVFAAIVGLKHI